MPEKQLNEEMREKCEGEFTLGECESAINKMKKNKSPGLDGISIEFYEKFWPLIGNLLVDVFNHSYENEILSDSQRTAVFTLIYKKDDSNDLSNYRPISVTNVDYRIMAFVLATRLQLVIDSIINHDQTAYIKKRYTGYNIRLIDDVVDYFDRFQKKGVLFMADFQKAFDSLDWGFMFKTLDFFKFGPSFKRWIRTLYTLPVGRIKNNGYLSDVFSVSRGIRQGCPVSALLFILAIELFGLRIRQEIDLRGFDFGFPEKPLKMVQYADDCILLLNNVDEMCTVISILDYFGNVSGLQLNLSKCEGLWLGQNKYRQKNCTLFGIRWPDQIRCLGIYIGYSTDKNIQINWNCKIDKVENVFESWSKRELSLFGKIQIIKTFALSQFVLPASLVSVPLDIVKRIEKILYQFLWGGKDKVKRKKITQELKDGGLNMVDIESIFRSFKAVWVSRIFQSNPCIHGWVQLAHHYLKPFLDCSEDLVFNFDSTVNFCEIQKLNSFYKEVFASYNTAFVKTKESFISGIQDECLWGNKFFVHRINGKNKVLFLRNWIRSGVNKVSDLQFIDGELDMNFMYDRIMYRSNIFLEILIVREALLPYKEHLKNVDVLQKCSCSKP